MVLTLGFYLFNPKSQTKKEQEIFAERVNRITGFNRSAASFGFRVANYVSVNPEEKGKGLDQGGKRVIEIWEKYVEKDKELAKLSKIYNNFINESEITEISLQEKFEDIANDNLKPRLTNVTYFNRSSKVRNNTLKRAKGMCELCGKEAPFKTKYDEPYLEIHHVIELSNDGADSTDNTIALCPNCHMRIHYGKELTDEEKKIINNALTKTF